MRGLSCELFSFSWRMQFLPRSAPRGSLIGGWHGRLLVGATGMRRVLGRAKLEKRDVKLFQRISSEVERGLGSLGRERDGRSREKRDN
jgi:hypothetical protein